MNKKPMAWEQELLASPHPTEGFTPALRDEIIRLSQTNQAQPFFNKQVVSIISLVLGLAILLFPFREAAITSIKDWMAANGPSHSTSMRQWLDEPQFWTSLQTIIHQHEFPQARDSFRETAIPEQNGEAMLYSEITMAELSQSNETKVSYRIRIEERSQGRGQSVAFIELTKDWNTGVNETDAISRWTYEISDGKIKLLSEESKGSQIFGSQGDE